MILKIALFLKKQVRETGTFLIKNLQTDSENIVTHADERSRYTDAGERRPWRKVMAGQ